MRKIGYIVLTLGFVGSAFAADSTWLTSVPQAVEQAKRENKLVLLDFTGSDWCGWCKKLDADTFSKPEFIDYAGKNLVLVEVDFPSKKYIPPELKEANHALKEKYEVKGYPTVIVLKPDGTVVWKHVGYLAGGPSAMIAKLGDSKPTLSLPTTVAPVAAPMQWPAPTPKNPGDEPRLQGILYSTSHASVVLDGKACAEGGTVKGMHVLKITRDKVTVEWNGKTKELTME